MEEYRTLIVGTSRDAYSVGDVIEDAMTVKDLIDILSEYDEDDKFVLSFDDGYTYGCLDGFRERWVSPDTEDPDDY